LGDRQIKLNSGQIEYDKVLWVQRHYLLFSIFIVKTQALTFRQ
jgi:hypothetical protein